MKARLRVAAGLVLTFAATVLPVVSGAGPAEATTMSVADEAQYRSALNVLSSDPSGPHVVEVTADFVLIGGADPAYTGTQPLTIDGNGFTIDGGGNSRLLNHYLASVEVKDLTAVNAHPTTSGGGVLTGSGPVTVTDSTFTDNSTPQGGGVISTVSEVTVTGSTFSDNISTSGVGAGAILTTVGATITDSTFTDSSPGAVAAWATGGGSTQPPVQVTASTFSGNLDSITLRVGGNVEITDSIFTDNRGGVVTGPAPFVTPGGNVTVTGSTFTGNDALNSGGAIQAGGAVTITESTLSDNSNAGPLGTTGGGAVNAEGQVIISRSTLNGNVTPDASGGAVASFDQVRVVDSTFIANATGGGGGGAIRADSVVATNSTFTFNKAVSATGGLGGAIAASNSIDLVHSTLVQNEATNGGANLASISGPVRSYGSVVIVPEFGVTNCVIFTGAFISNGYNYSDDTSCGFTGTGDTQGGGDPMLEVLGDYGGPTQTRPPTLASPLVDAIPVGDCDPAVTTDQRGQVRPADGNGDGTDGCDIGAVELEAFQGPPSDPGPAPGAPGPPPWVPGPPPWVPGPPPWATGPPS